MVESLKAATFEVLETMFFLFPENLEEAATLFHGPGLRAWVPVEGPKNFRVGLTVPLPLAQEMAANFLGLEKDRVTPENLEDVVKETANMVAGSFFIKEQVPRDFNLKPPEAIRLDLDSQHWEENSHHLLLAVEDLGLEVFLEKTK
uniref:Chemotaxis protein CheX n=1 Tax=Desulfobacca acetoxidans TaxID=60893 RepID=A0A7C3UXB6_9BACT